MKYCRAKSDTQVNFEAPKLLVLVLQSRARNNRHDLQKEIAMRVSHTVGREEIMESVFLKFSSEFNRLLKTLH